MSTNANHVTAIKQSKKKQLLKDIKCIPNEINQPEEFIDWLFNLVAEENIKELKEIVDPRILSEYGILEALLKNKKISAEAFTFCHTMIQMAQMNVYQYDYSVVMNETVYAILETSDKLPQEDREYDTDDYDGGNKWNLLTEVFHFNIDIMQLITDLNNGCFKQYITERPDFLSNILYTILKSQYKIYFRKIDIYSVINDFPNNLLKELHKILIDIDKILIHDMFIKRSKTGDNFYDKLLLQTRIYTKFSVYTEHSLDRIISYLNDEMNDLEKEKSISVSDFNTFLIFKFVDFDVERIFHSKIKEAKYIERIENIKKELLKKIEIYPSLMDEELRMFEFSNLVNNYVKMIDADVKEMRTDVKVELNIYTPLIPDLQNIVVNYL
jgi:hypothetical protein